VVKRYLSGLSTVCAFWREPAGTIGPIRLPEFGIDLTLDEVYVGVAFD
jgi:hypothetical protein